MTPTHFGRLAALAPMAALIRASSIGLSQVQGARHPVATEKIDESRLTVLPRNVRSAALDPANDRGAVADTLPLEDILLQLQRSPASEAALTAYIASINDSSSPNYHKWLTAEQLGEQYGPASSDIAVVTNWLISMGSP